MKFIPIIIVGIIEIVGIIGLIVNRKYYGKLSILIIVLLLNTIAFSIVEMYLLDFNGLYNIKSAIIFTLFNLLSIILKVIVIYKTPKDKDELFLALSRITKLDIIGLMGVGYVIIKLLGAK